VTLDGMKWRLAGPFRGGRSVAAAGDPRRRSTFYFGACAGGVFKTEDGGISWLPVSDGQLATSSVGAIAVADSDPNVLYIGMGEACIRDNVSHGDGVYGSTDSGRTWRHLGLEQTRHIARVRIDPRDPETVYVAALGHAWGHNEDRGVFRSRDGGRTWEKVLYRGPGAGACDLYLDPTNPRILYAAMWETLRTPYSFVSGGPQSGLFKSTDGGDSWVELRTGLPEGLKGRIGVTASPANPDRVWAVVEAGDGGVFRSDNAGVSWKRVSDSRDQLQRPWYFMHIFADTQDANRVYTLSLRAWKSIDGGATFVQWPMPHGDDHDLWIDPRDSSRMIAGNDGGACVSFDAGASWSTQYNQPTAQFYHVITDHQFPYRIYGAQQDNTTLSVPTRSDRGAITRSDSYPVGGSECGYIAIRPDNPDVVYAGSFAHRMTRHDRHTGQTRDITVWPDDPIGWAAKDVKYRFNWTFPIVLSPHDPNVLYAAGNHVFRSTDEGHSWDPISPDLTLNDPKYLQASGGPITKDNYSTEYFCTIFSLAESPVQRGVLWAGTDDGLIHLSRNGGESWDNVTPAILPELALMSIIDPSPHDAATCYVAATRYKLDDFRPYLLSTHDFGETWTLINEGIPSQDFTRVIRADPEVAGLLFAGSETTVYYSTDDGATWDRIQLNLPVTPIHDLAIRDGDLVAGTHGRSFWVLDDITPLRQLSAGIRESAAHLFKPRPAYRLQEPRWYLASEEPEQKTYVVSAGDLVSVAYISASPEGEQTLEFVDAGKNPPPGVSVNYWLKEAIEGEVKLHFKDGLGSVLREFASGRASGQNGSSLAEPRPTRRAGLNRFNWDLRLPGPTPVNSGRLFNYWSRGNNGPVVAPGNYSVELMVGGQVIDSVPFAVLRDPRAPVTDDDLQEQVALLLKIQSKVSEVNTVINEIERVDHQLDDWTNRLEGSAENSSLAPIARELKERLQEVLGKLTQAQVKTGSDFAAYPPMLNSRLMALGAFVSGSDYAPTVGMHGVFADLCRQVDDELGRLHGLIDDDLAAFEQRIEQAGVRLIASSLGRHETA